jgi:hypothetical protein
MDELILSKPKSIIAELRKKYGGKWVYRADGVWEHIGHGYVTSHTLVDEFDNPYPIKTYFYRSNEEGIAPIHIYL